MGVSNLDDFHVQHEKSHLMQHPLINHWVGMTPVLSVEARNLDRHHQIEYQIYIQEELRRKRATEVYGFCYWFALILECRWAGSKFLRHAHVYTLIYM